VLTLAYQFKFRANTTYAAIVRFPSLSLFSYFLKIRTPAAAYNAEGDHGGEYTCVALPPNSLPPFLGEFLEGVDVTSSLDQDLSSFLKKENVEVWGDEEDEDTLKDAQGKAEMKVQDLERKVKKGKEE